MDVKQIGGITTTISEKIPILHLVGGKVFKVELTTIENLNKANIQSITVSGGVESNVVTIESSGKIFLTSQPLAKGVWVGANKVFIPQVNQRGIIESVTESLAFQSHSSYFHPGEIYSNAIGKAGYAVSAYNGLVAGRYIPENSSSNITVLYDGRISDPNSNLPTDEGNLVALRKLDSFISTTTTSGVYVNGNITPITIKVNSLFGDQYIKPGNSNFLAGDVVAHPYSGSPIVLHSNENSSLDTITSGIVTLTAREDEWGVGNTLDLEWYKSGSRVSMKILKASISKTIGGDSEYVAGVVGTGPNDILPGLPLALRPKNTRVEFIEYSPAPGDSLKPGFGGLWFNNIKKACVTITPEGYLKIGKIFDTSETVISETIQIQPDVGFDYPDSRSKVFVNFSKTLSGVVTMEITGNLGVRNIDGPWGPPQGEFIALRNFPINASFAPLATKTIGLYTYGTLSGTKKLVTGLFSTGPGIYTIYLGHYTWYPAGDDVQIYSSSSWTI